MHGDLENSPNSALDDRTTRGFLKDGEFGNETIEEPDPPRVSFDLIVRLFLTGRRKLLTVNSDALKVTAKVSSERKLGVPQARDASDEKAGSCAGEAFDSILTRDDIQAADTAHEDLKWGRTISLAEARKKHS